ncbi:hypothetical protein [Dethiobacter alkaliphilus]|uniref:hypothetical protein n=1 Tax=Dethiobacter alkaliphilus TaxID=427926 RepID=UPI002227189C|nr:hypothetical protein [Dethiobacter alkaliphilus]MCW3488664.1 hypothetical protein [Dethiobacter alkaliphilus]
MQELLRENKFHANSIYCLGLPDKFIERGSTGVLLDNYAPPRGGIFFFVYQFAAVNNYLATVLAVVFLAS